MVESKYVAFYPHSLYFSSLSRNAQGARAVWLGEHDRIATTGFSKMSDRQVSLWEAGSLNNIKTTTIDQSSGVLMPFWSDNNILFLGASVFVLTSFTPTCLYSPLDSWQGVRTLNIPTHIQHTLIIDPFTTETATYGTTNTNTTSYTPSPNTNPQTHNVGCVSSPAVLSTSPNVRSLGRIR